MSVDAPIICAGDRELPQLVDGPDVRDTVSGYCRPMTLLITTLTPDGGGDARETRRRIDTSGFFLPTTARKLDIKDDGTGTRKWKFWEVWVLNDPNVAIGDKIEVEERVFKCVKNQDFSQFGYVKFGATEDFKP